VLGYAGVAAGAALLVAGGIEIGKWVGDQHTTDHDRAQVPMNVSDVCATSGNAAATACQAAHREATDAVLAWVFTIAGAALAGTGTWLVVTSRASAEPPAAPRASLAIVPAVGSHSQSLDLRVTF
jgi:hypothetical protein